MSLTPVRESQLLLAALKLTFGNKAEYTHPDNILCCVSLAAQGAAYLFTTRFLLALQRTALEIFHFRSFMWHTDGTPSCLCLLDSGNGIVLLNMAHFGGQEVSITLGTAASVVLVWPDCN